MIWMFLLAVVMGFVFFKLGVLTVMFALLQGLLKLLFVLSGLFLVVAAWNGSPADDARPPWTCGSCGSGGRKSHGYSGTREWSLIEGPPWVPGHTTRWFIGSRRCW